MLRTKYRILVPKSLKEKKGNCWLLMKLFFPYENKKNKEQNLLRRYIPIEQVKI